MISIIVPTYNEASNITELVIRISKALTIDYELIIVDDGSDDGTGKIAEDLSKRYPIKVLHRGGLLGLSSAVIDGMKICSGGFIGVIDADLSHPPEMIPILLRNIVENNADIVIASRFVNGGGVENWPKKRLMLTKTAQFIVRPLVGDIKDPMSGFFILRRTILSIDQLVPRGFKILLEILVKSRCSKVIECPFVFKDREHGVSKLTPKVLKDFIRQLSDLYFYSFRRIFLIKE